MINKPGKTIKTSIYEMQKEGRQKKMIKSRRGAINGLVAGIVLVGAVLLSACAPAAPPEEEVAPPPPKEPISVGFLTDLTGPAAGIGTPVTMGLNHYVRYVNEDKDGIDGHPIKLVCVDTKYQIAEYVSGYERLRQIEGTPCVIVLGSGGSAAVRPLCCRDKMVALVTPELMALFPDEGSWVFTPIPSYGGEYRASLRWLKEEFWKGERPPRIAMHIIDAIPGYSGANAIKIGLQDVGWQDAVVCVNWSAPTATDLSTQILEIKASNPDIVNVMQTFGPSIVFYKQMRDLGLVPGPTIFSAGTEMFSLGVYELEASTDIITQSAFALWEETEVPGIRLARHLSSKYEEEEIYAGFDYFWGFSQGMVLEEGLRRAVENVGYENLTPTALKEALETFRDFDTMGLLGPITYTLDDHTGAKASRVVYHQSATYPYFRAMSDWIPIPKWVGEQRTTDFWKTKPEF